LILIFENSLEEKKEAVKAWERKWWGWFNY